MQSGENIQGLSRILDFMRLGSVVILLVHFYCVCYPAVQAWKLSTTVGDRLVFNLSHNIFFMAGINRAKIASLLLLVISCLGVKGRKDENIKLAPVLFYIFAGLVLYFISSLFLQLTLSETVLAELYIVVTALGFLSILAGSSQITRLLFLKYNKDTFNDLNETFPQEERLLQNEFSVNLPAQYHLKGRLRKSWINIVSPMRSTLVAGTAGAGKSYYVIRWYITQMISKGYTMFLYDFKFPDLTTIAYNTALKHMDKYPKPLKFYFINFDDLSRSHRCNPLSPDAMLDITDATESSRTMMLALNREWIKKQGDFFVESPVNFVTAIFWYLKKYEKGRYCTLPHAIELAQIEYDRLFPILTLESEIEVLINPFISAYKHGANEQLEGQVASAKICLARLASPSLYYILSGNDFTLDLNNPDKPKIIAAGNNPSKQGIYGAVLSLYIERMLKLVNKKGQLKSALIFDEFPTVYAEGVIGAIATARSNLVAPVLAVQDFAQLRKDYGKELADVIMNISGNIIAGQVIGDTAKQLSERIGKIMQERESISINSNDTSVSKSTQLEAAIPPAKIANMSSGHFVGAVADTPSQRILHKAFHCEIINDHDAIKAEETVYQELPVLRRIDQAIVMDNYYQIKRDVQRIVDLEYAKIANHPELKIIEKKRA